MAETREERLKEQYQVIKDLDRQRVYQMLKDFVCEPDGIELGDYCDIEFGDYTYIEYYHQDKAASQKSKRLAMKQLRQFKFIEWNAAIFTQALVDGFSGRLSIVTNAVGKPQVSYTSGQSGTMEYRDAVAEVLRIYKTYLLYAEENKAEDAEINAPEWASFRAA